MGLNVLLFVFGVLFLLKHFLYKSKQNFLETYATVLATNLPVHDQCLQNFFC